MNGFLWAILLILGTIAFLYIIYKIGVLFDIGDIIEAILDAGDSD